MKGKITPLRAIRMKCIDCSNYQLKEIRCCTVIDCALYPFRFGHKPKYDSDDKEGI